MDKKRSLKSGKRESKPPATLDQFKMVDNLGDGAYSKVYKVKRLADGKEYALKMVLLKNLSDKEKENAINEVRNRAKMADLTPGLTKDQFREKVRRERVLELTLEDMRQIDLMRWGQYPQRIIDNPDFRNGELFYVQGREYFPIPQVEVDTNPNIVQNPGY